MQVSARSPIDQRIADAVRVPPHLTHVIRPQGQLALMPQENSTHSRKPKREKRQKQERQPRTHEEPHFNVGAPRTPRRGPPGSPGGRPRTSRRPDVSDAGMRASLCWLGAAIESRFSSFQAQFQTTHPPPLMRPSQRQLQPGMLRLFHQLILRLPTPRLRQTDVSQFLSLYPLYPAPTINLWSAGHSLILRRPSQCGTALKLNTTRALTMGTWNLSLLARQQHRQPHRSRIAPDAPPAGEHRQSLGLLPRRPTLCPLRVHS
jgi:hypothetical protein